MSVEIEKVLYCWQEWNLFTDKPQLIKIFTDGLSHDTALIGDGNTTLVLKKFRSESTTAITAQEYAAAVGLTPNIRYINADNDVVLMDYVEARAVCPNTLTNESIAVIAQSVRRLHKLEISHEIAERGRFNMSKFCQRYLKNAGAWARQQHQRFENTIREFDSDNSQLAFCHNDLVAANILISNKTVQFIDWEYTQLNNPWFDLAAIIFYLDLSHTQIKLLLDQYQIEFDQRSLDNATTALLWGDVLWHLSKFGDAYLPKLEDKIAHLNTY